MSLNTPREKCIASLVDAAMADIAEQTKKWSKVVKTQRFYALMGGMTKGAKGRGKPEALLDFRLICAKCEQKTITGPIRRCGKCGRAMCHRCLTQKKCLSKNCLRPPEASDSDSSDSSSDPSESPPSPPRGKKQKKPGAPSPQKPARKRRKPAAASPTQVEDDGEEEDDEEVEDDDEMEDEEKGGEAQVNVTIPKVNDEILRFFVAEGDSEENTMKSFLGTVTELKPARDDDEEDLWHVKYEDEEEEDLNLGEVIEARRNFLSR